MLAVLMLRGPQTAGELRINCDRLHKFADIPPWRASLRELAERPAGALVVELARQPGSRENRWAHLLSGPRPEEQRPSVLHSASPTDDHQELAALTARVDALEAGVSELKQLIAALQAGHS
jgi:uncharacterized protein YceH (UPF0502 family)